MFPGPGTKAGGGGGGGGIALGAVSAVQSVNGTTRTTAAITTTTGSTACVFAWGDAVTYNTPTDSKYVHPTCCSECFRRRLCAASMV